MKNLIMCLISLIVIGCQSASESAIEVESFKCEVGLYKSWDYDNQVPTCVENCYESQVIIDKECHQLCVIYHVEENELKKTHYTCDYTEMCIPNAPHESFQLCEPMF